MPDNSIIAVHDDDWLAELVGTQRATIRALRRQASADRLKQLTKAKETLRQLSGDAETSAVIDRWYRAIMSGHETFQQVSLELTIRLRACELSIHCLDDYASAGVLYSIFANEEYGGGGSVDVIYDLGANIGLAALYFHCVHPKAKIVCVEPEPRNLAMLRENVTANRLNADIIPAAIGNRTGTATLFIHPFAHVSHAMVKKTVGPDLCLETRTVGMVSFDEVIQGRNYGIKMDIEGSEHLMCHYPEIIKSASWIVGELHYGVFVDPGYVGCFETLLKKDFAVQTSEPVIVDDRINRHFRAVRKPL